MYVVYSETPSNGNHVGLETKGQLMHNRKASIEEDREGVGNEPSIVVFVLEVLHFVGAIDNTMEIQEDYIGLDLSKFLGL